MNMFRPEPSVSGMRFSSHAYSIQNDESLHIQTVVKALLYRRFLSQQLDAIFVALKPGFHIIAPVATIASVVEKRVSATVAIYGNILFSDSSDKYDSGDERR